MRILALMPCYKIIEVPAVQTLLALQADIYNRGDNINFLFTQGFNAVKARTALVNSAAKKDFDYVVWLDSDHIYSAGALYTLIEKIEKNNLDMLSAGYFVRGYVRGQKRFAHGDFVNGDYQKLSPSEHGGIRDCEVVGFGFLVMKHAFVKRMVEKYPNDLFKMDISDNLTEDVYFCRKCKQEGVRVCFDEDTIVGHLMTVINN